MRVNGGVLTIDIFAAFIKKPRINRGQVSNYLGTGIWSIVSKRSDSVKMEIL